MAERTRKARKQRTAPSAVTPNSESNLASAYNWNAYHQLTSANFPNGATQACSYDFLNRPASVTSPHGAVTTHAYNDTATPASRLKLAERLTAQAGRSISDI